MRIFETQMYARNAFSSSTVLCEELKMLDSDEQVNIEDDNKAEKLFEPSAVRDLRMYSIFLGSIYGTTLAVPIGLFFPLDVRLLPVLGTFASCFVGGGVTGYCLQRFVFRDFGTSFFTYSEANIGAKRYARLIEKIDKLKSLIEIQDSNRSQYSRAKGYFESTVIKYQTNTQRSIPWL